MSNATTAAHDWTMALAEAHKAQPRYVLFSYSRGDGIATVFGSVYATLRVEGKHCETWLDYGAVAEAEYPNDKLSGKKVDGVFAAHKKAALGACQVSDLRSACGLPPVETVTDATVRCPECRGSGREECPHCGQDMDCEECGGTGTTTGKEYDEPEERRLRIGDHILDANLLASVFRAVPDETVRIAVAAPLRFEGHGWTLLAMPLVTDPRDTDILFTAISEVLTPCAS